MADARRYYPGFFAALFLVLLRIAIGWHFAYEGMEKIDSQRRGGKPFSAEAYLRNSTGPLAPYFRGMVPDVNSFGKLEPERLKAAWNAEVERIESHYAFQPDQRAKAEEILRKSEEEADLWFQDRLFQEKRRKYYHELAETQAIERNWHALSYERERAAAKRKDLDADRRELVKDLDTIEGAMRDAVVKLATTAQTGAAGPYQAKAPPFDFTRVRDLKAQWNRMTTLEKVNLATMYGLLIMGFCLMVGFITRPAALAGAIFLGQIYLSMPPWPGLPPNPLAEGHYMIVNKNLIEMLACLALTFLPTGRWVGLDALLFNWIGRRRAAALDDDEPERGRHRRSHTLAQPRSY